MQLACSWVGSAVLISSASWSCAGSREGSGPRSPGQVVNGSRAGGANAGADERDDSGTLVELRSVPCPDPEAIERRFVAPSFALDAPADVAWLGEHLVLVNLASDHARRQVPNGGQAGFFAAIYDPTTNAWTELPAPTLPLGEPDVDYRWRIVGRHLFVFYFSTYRPVVGGWSFNVDQSTWTELPWEGGPPAEAFLSGPYLDVGEGNHWVFWSRRGKQSFHDGYILDLHARTWTRTSTAGAPAGRFARLRPLSDGRVLVVPVEASTAGVFNYLTNTWRPFPLPGAYPSTAVVAPDESAFAWVAWEPGTPRLASPMHAWVFDLRSLAATRLASTSETFTHPNADAVYFDAQRIYYLDEAHLFVQPRRGGGWQSHPLPFAPLLPQQAKWIPLCQRRLLLRYHPPYWALDLDALQWQPYAWSVALPHYARHVVVGRDRIVLIGRQEERLACPGCGPRIPCVGPSQRLTDDLNGFIVGLR